METLDTEAQRKPVGDELPKSAEELEALTEAQKLALATKNEFYACQGKFTTSNERTIPYTIIKEFRNDNENEDDTEHELVERGHLGLNEESVLVSSLVTGSGKSGEAFRIWTIAPAKQPGYVQINYSFPIARAYDGVAKREARATYMVIVPEVLGENIQRQFEQNPDFAEDYLAAMDEDIAAMDRPAVYGIISRDLRDEEKQPELRELHEKSQEYKIPYDVRKTQAYQDFAHEHGLDPETTYTKQELLDQGFGMANRIGNGERAIVNEADGQDTSRDFFLTTEQLRAHIRESLPEGVTLEDLPHIEEDMAQFMQEVRAAVGANKLLTDSYIIMNQLLPFMDELSAEHPEWDVEQRMQKMWEENPDVVDDLPEQAANQSREHWQVPRDVRGIPIENLAGRSEGNNTLPCPCMECSVAFPAENGIKIFDEDGSITGRPNTQVRMNSISRHLAGHGVCNNGNEAVKDPDQRYMTLKEYLPLYERRDAGQPAIAIDELEKELFTTALHLMCEKLGLEDLPEERVKQAIREYLYLE